MAENYNILCYICYIRLR